MASVNSVNTLASPTAGNTSAASDEASSMVGKDAFMKLLVQQLRNQDPLNPMDSREFVTQLSQLTSVEKLTAMEQRLQYLEVATAGMANTQTADLVGKTVTANASHISVGTSGTPAAAPFTLATAAQTVHVKVTDSYGQVVHEEDLPATSLTAGAHTFSWDGKDVAGQRVNPGNYSLEFTAKDANGNDVDVTTKRTGVINAISYENGAPMLMMGDVPILLSDVISIGQ